MEKVGTSTKGAELQTLPAPTGAENRAARKLMELEAGQVLVAQAAKQAGKQEQSLRKSVLRPGKRNRKGNSVIRRSFPGRADGSDWRGSF